MIISGGGLSITSNVYKSENGIESGGAIHYHAAKEMSFTNSRVESKGELTLASPSIKIDGGTFRSVTQEYHLYTDNLELKNLDVRTVALLQNARKPYADYRG